MVSPHETYSGQALLQVMMFKPAPWYLLVFLVGDMDIISAPRAGERVAAMAKDLGVRIVVLDFTAVSFFDSTGLATVILLSKRLRERGGHLLLAGLPGHCQEMFTRTGLRRRLRIFDTRQEAGAYAARLAEEQPARS
ncbi:STAS domain-containing protein [Bailinhaonella thermotolerans]|uniref:STAS domain-containing protein n=1 Tax=Bailinhaonella thermotolerans TaxID=1070861 RepID=UPI00192A4477|nr:STAS domain-containing protein [Bailinhaonella thermotolerans]